MSEIERETGPRAVVPVDRRPARRPVAHLALTAQPRLGTGRHGAESSGSRSTPSASPSSRPPRGTLRTAPRGDGLRAGTASPCERARCGPPRDRGVTLLALVAEGPAMGVLGAVARRAGAAQPGESDRRAFPRREGPGLRLVAGAAGGWRGRRRRNPPSACLCVYALRENVSGEWQLWHCWPTCPRWMSLWHAAHAVPLALNDRTRPESSRAGDRRAPAAGWPPGEPPRGAWHWLQRRATCLPVSWNAVVPCETCPPRTQSRRRVAPLACAAQFLVVGIGVAPRDAAPRPLNVHDVTFAVAGGGGAPASRPWQSRQAAAACRPWKRAASGAACV